MAEPEKHQVEPGNARQFREWLMTRGGLALWQAQDGSAESWTCPLNDAEGKPKGPPHWKCGPSGRPYRVITDPNEVEVVIPRLVETIDVKLKPGWGMTLVLTGGSQNRLNKALARAGEGAYYVRGDLQFPCMHIFVPAKVIPLLEFDVEAWEKEQEGKS